MFRWRMTPAQKEALQKAAEKHGIPMTTFIEAATEAAMKNPDFMNPLIDLFLKALGKKLKKVVDVKAIMKAVEAKSS